MPDAVGVEVDHRVVDRLLGRVEVLDEVLEPALVEVDGLGRDLVALVAQRDRQSGVEERHLLQPPGEGLVGVDGRLEDRRVGPERDRRAGVGGRGALAQLTLGLAAVDERVVPDEPVPLDLDVEPGGQRVDDRDADAVQPAGDGVGLAVELAAGVQRRHDDLDRGPLLDRMPVDRDAAAVVGRPGRRRRRSRRADDRVGMTGERLIDGVVDDLVDQVVQAALAGRADVHAGALAHRLEALENGDGPRVVRQRNVSCSSPTATTAPYAPCRLGFRCPSYLWTPTRTAIRGPWG